MARQIDHLSRSDDTYLVSEDSSALDIDSKKEDYGDGEIDAPAIFLCGKCRLPFGDSLSWAGSDDEQNQILLKRVNENIVVGKEPFVYGTNEEQRCLAVNLTCRGCSVKLGHMYMSTPKSLDYKSYVLGSSDQQVAAVDSEERPVTLEYMDNVERQMTKIKSLAVTIGQRLLEIEVDLQGKLRTT
ncbi:protein Mis18-alpha [Silurus meridionalis]|nr:protein Mis18-alpha [Silurus meridionalis]